MEPRTIGRESMIKYADLYSEYRECQQPVDEAIERCIRNSSFINGPEVLAFESQWAEYTRSRACAGTSSGTSALMLALETLSVGPGDEVIVPSMSFISTAEVVSQLGARPIMVDIDQYHTLALDQVAQHITPHTKAIITVDLYGQTTDLDQLLKIAGDTPVIQDAAQSAVCEYQDQRIGDLVYATCWSFYPGKNLSAMGDAGAVTGSEQMCAQVRYFRDHGRTEKYVHTGRGWNERLDGLQASVLGAKIKFLDEWNLRRQENARVYEQELSGVEEISLPQTNPVSSHVYNQYVITTDQRHLLKIYLAEQGIETGLQFPLAMHQQPVYENLNTGVLINSEQLAATCLSLPVHAQIKERDVRKVCQHVKDFFHMYSQSGRATTAS
jgi:dTDP-4-amino-4,6-dideoxygalactose transaminase